MTPTEIIYDFKVKEPLDMLGTPNTSVEGALPEASAINRFEEALRNPTTPATDTGAFVINYRPTHMNVKDVINFASMKMKKYYDKHHQPMFFKVDDLIKLRLHRRYELPGISTKLKQQFVGSFKVIKRIGRFAYRLQLPTNIRIHNVISIAQLKPIMNPASNPYERRPPPLPSTILNDDEIERLIRKRSRHIGRSKNKITKYLIRWAGRDPKHDV